MTTLTVSPLAPKTIPTLPPIAGVKLAAGAFGLRYKGRPDIVLVELVENTTVAGVFTQSTTAAAPVLWCRRALSSQQSGRALLVNAGQANAFTGEIGEQTVTATTQALAETIGCAAEETYIASTGVIGQPIPTEPLVAAIRTLHTQLSDDDWEGAAAAIRTTDTFSKCTTRTVKIGETDVTINGIAKGSGMIAPNMATMLSYFFTDAAIPQNILQQLLTESNDRSFNSITVDSDQSTNDSAQLFATGQADHPPVTSMDDPHFQDFRHAFASAMIELAQLIVRDGEGAQKFITVQVDGAQDDASARRIALAIANSPLVKTAIAGEDANWGRIVMAIGKSGEPIDASAISIAFGSHQIAKDGAPVPNYDETPVAAYMKQPAITITSTVGTGQGSATVWTCDLTHGYIDINADYRS